MPLLSPSTVQAVRDLPISTVVGQYVQLKAKGGNEWGCCPFHDEKSPSFEVHLKTNTFHCFGCGAKGDGIGFVVKHDGLDFVAAVEKLASAHSVPLEYEQGNLTPEQLAAEEARRAERKEVTAVLEWAAAWFAANRYVPSIDPNAEPVEVEVEAFAEYVRERQLLDTTVQQAGLGYAPAGGRVLLEAANKAGYLAPALVKASLVREVKTDTTTTYYDFFQDRLMFPIRDARGLCIAFSGRYIGPKPEDGKFQPPKAINSDEATWTKGAHLYGLDTAAKAIRDAKFAYLVEGQADRLQLVQHELPNTVAQGGTALTDEQVALLKRYTDHVVIVYDHDAAGWKALAKYGPVLLAAGFQVSYLVPAWPKHEGRNKYDFTQPSDPDSFLRSLATQAPPAPPKPKRGKKAASDEPAPEPSAEYSAQLLGQWVRSRKDFIIDYAVPEAMRSEDLGPVEMGDAITALGELIESLPLAPRRTVYYDQAADLWPKFKKTYKLQKRKADPVLEVKKETKEALSRLTPEQMTASMEAGFFERDGGYWYFDAQKGRDLPICQFTLDFLFFVVSNNRPKYVCRLTNSFGRNRLTTFSTDDLVSKDSFNKAIGKLHGYVFEGSQFHLNRIKIKQWAGCREALEASLLGWNERTQLYAFNNGLLQHGTFYPADKYGVVTLRKPVASVEAIEQMAHESQLEVDGTVPVLNTPSEILPALGGDEVAQLVAANKVVELSYHYLPAGGTALLSAEESDDLAVKFKHLPTATLTFTEWAKLICTVHGTDNGRTMVAFYIGALFRSIIHKANGGYFPILFHFGLMGSGKSQSCLSLMYMFGTPPHDDGLTLQSGSTTTAMQRILTGRSDALVWLNEYKNTLPDGIIGTLKDLAGGSGKTVGVMSSGNETRTMVPRSAALIAGEQLPTIAQSLLDRCIINEFDKREHQYEPYKKLQDLQNAGQCTAVTCQLLGYRDVVATGYKKMEPTCTAELRAEGKALLGTEPNSRAILNLTSVLTPVRLLMDAGVEFPFSYDELKATLLGKLSISVAIQSESNDVETFFLTLTGLAPHLCEEGYHYKIEKDTQGRTLLFLRTRNVHGAYMQALKAQGGAPMAISGLRSYLEKHRSYVEEVKSTRFASPDVPNATSAMVFDYEQLRQQGIEFRTKVNLRTAKAAIPEPEQLAPAKIHLNGNVLELMADFIGSLAVSDDNPRERYNPLKLYEAFNADKDNPLTTEQFHDALRLDQILITRSGMRKVQQVQLGENYYYEVTVTSAAF